MTFPFGSKGRIVLAYGVILTVTFIAYAPTLQNDFLFWDDTVHILENPSIRSLSGGNLMHIFTSLVNDTYIPFTTLSWALEYHFFGLNPFIFHLNNLLLHLAVAALVLRLCQLWGLSLGASTVATLIFALHPMHVESVAWATARKDMLYAVFYLGSVIVYCRYIKDQKRTTYLLTLPLGLFSILAKATALSLPLIFFIMDWLYGRTWSRRLIWEKLPHILYIIPIAWPTFILNTHIYGVHLNVLTSALIFMWTFVLYIVKILFPIHLVPIYDLPQPVDLFNRAYVFSTTAFLLLGASVWRFHRQRWFLFGLLYFVGSIFFMLRFGDTSDTDIISDRYIYLPCLGISVFLGVMWQKGYTWAQSRRPLFKPACLTIAVVVCLGLSAKTFQQCQIWKDSIVLLTYLIDHARENTMVYNNRGAAYRERGQYTQALEDFNRALEIDSKYAEFAKTYHNRGLVYFKMGRYEEAHSDYNRSLEFDSTNPMVYYNRGILHFAQRHYDQALADYNQALKLYPDYSKAYMNRGNVYIQRGDYQAALKDYTAALELQPQNPLAYFNRGNIYSRNKQYPLAIQDYTQALQLSSRFVQAYLNRALAYNRIGQFQPASEDMQMALSIVPDFTEGYILLANYLVGLKHYDQAREQLLRARGLYEKKGQTQKAQMVEDILKGIP